MAFDGGRRLVILGFGAIGACLFAYEAQRCGAYGPPMVVDVSADLVTGIRADDGYVRVNIARADGIETAKIGPIEVADPTVPDERAAIVEAIATADELATALPSVAFYRGDGPASPHLLLAGGLRRRSRPDPLIVFCAENHRRAAGLLGEAVLDAAEEAAEFAALRSRARYADTVIGKMSGVITGRAEVSELGLATITSGQAAAFLVEEFDRILVSRVDSGNSTAALRPGIPVLREVDDLAPYEDAKLLGHNATHALGAFLGQLLGLSLFSDLRDVPGAMAFLRIAFTEESGPTLIARYGGAGRRLFTPRGYADFADDLLARMVNPYLADTIDRAARDPHRKLGWDDRFFGLIRLGLAEGVPTPRYAMGAAAGLEALGRRGEDGGDPEILARIWPDDADAGEVHAVLAVIEEGQVWLQRWRRDGFDGLPGRG